MISDYLNVLKPRETGLLVFIGACSAVVSAAVAGGAFPINVFILTVIAITCGSAGANGLTNYLDRDVDARMARTCKRALAAGRIKPPQKVLPLIAVLIVVGLVLAWLLSPLCFAIGLVGILASGILRKTVSCTYFGIIAGSSPVLIGWYAISQQPVIAVMPVLFFCLIAAWTPLHVWTLMLANRSDYEGAGLHYFPLSWPDRKIIKLLAVLSLALSVVGVLIYFLSGILHWLYLAVAVLLSLLMVFASARLLLAPSSKNAWTVYKLSAFPYLGIVFTIMAADAWLL
ncbi:MAG: UbiA family prenyltransferase [Chloroflexi bacterium]|nr:UbiA family prenyltransferase [Chloroflexota bacterium]